MVAEVGRAVEDLSQVADAEVEVEVPDAEANVEQPNTDVQTNGGQPDTDREGTDTEGDVSAPSEGESADQLEGDALRNDGGFDWVDE
jgi:hypothetical protein